MITYVHRLSAASKTRSWFGVQIAISVAAAMLYFLISPVKKPTVELIARTGQTFFDVLITFFGGIAGSIGRPDKTKQPPSFWVLQLQPL